MLGFEVKVTITPKHTKRFSGNHRCSVPPVTQGKGLPVPMETKKVSDPSGRWTNARHMDYLRSMEASFVQTMLENNGGHLLPLDRYLPDSSESTTDLKNERRRRHSTSDIPDQRTRTDKKTRRLPSQPYTSSHDQVVPQLENGIGDKDARGHEP